MIPALSKGKRKINKMFQGIERINTHLIHPGTKRPLGKSAKNTTVGVAMRFGHEREDI